MSEDLDATMLRVLLHGDWNCLTRCMTTPEKESAACAVIRHSKRKNSESPILEVDLLVAANREAAMHLAHHPTSKVMTLQVFSFLDSGVQINIVKPQIIHGILPCS